MNNSFFSIVQKICWILLAFLLFVIGLKDFLIKKSFISLFIGIISFCSLVMLITSYILENKNGKRKNAKEI